MIDICGSLFHFQLAEIVGTGVVPTGRVQGMQSFMRVDIVSRCTADDR